MFTHAAGFLLPYDISAFANHQCSHLLFCARKTLRLK